ncbi:nucleotide exchange factor GrpE [Lichenicoccus sp.]|uniref:nucleotide exchange factor GrpE n=1 Tax=Lichenicoccus sp. TaxID=2781899 RepID=UPI003D0C10E6
MTNDDPNPMSEQQNVQGSEAEPEAPDNVIEAATQETVMQAAAGRIRELEAALEEMRDRWVRAEAETQNVRTRARREADDARQYAVQKFARDVVEAAENLRRGIASLPPPTDDDSPVLVKLREGFESVERSFLGVLERNGITGADPTGAVFDANLHQAMAEQPSAEHPPGTVIQAWTSAWTLNGRLLKPAMVVVAKAAPAAADALDRTV